MFGRNKDHQLVSCIAELEDGTDVEMTLREIKSRTNIFLWDADRRATVKQYVFFDAEGNWIAKPGGENLISGDTLSMVYTMSDHPQLSDG